MDRADHKTCDEQLAKDKEEKRAIVGFLEQLKSEMAVGKARIKDFETQAGHMGQLE